MGQYRIERLIGEGGMGEVYLAERADAQFEKRVAVKLLKRGMDTYAVLERFRTERQILAGFDHPNIARLFDGGTTEDGLPYFVMEYIEGEPIDEYCDTRRLSITERLELFRSVCGAVGYAHQHQVIHRDIKPSNIIVTADGVPKLLDFGVAKILHDEASGETASTAAAMRIMTLEYASPEQIRGERVTTASDVYSLGVVLYELLSGRSPYGLTSRSPVEIADAIVETEPDKPSTAIGRDKEAATGANGGHITRSGKDVSETREGSLNKLRRRLQGDLDNIVLMAMRKEPHRRYVSVEEFSEDVQRHLARLSVVALPDTLRYRAAKFIA